MHQALSRDRVREAVTILKSSYQVVAPTAKGKSFTFSQVDDAASVTLEYSSTILPLKKFFLPPVEVLLTYDTVRQTARAPEPVAEPLLFFGVHNYDLQGLLRLDHAFENGVPDPTWLARRSKAVFVGVSYTPDEHHFSPSVGIPTDRKDGFDLFLTRFGDHYRVESLTKTGDELVSLLRPILSTCDCPGEPVVQFKNKLRQSVAGIREVFHGAYNHPVWQETARRCLSCGTCNISCPTCYCFDVDDQTRLGGTEGDRLRRWDSCQFRSFSTVAGGEAFRDRRRDRVRHRMSRKFAYITDGAGQPFCVGCGRCVRQCAAGINIVEVINALL